MSEVWHRSVPSWLQPRIPEHVDWNHICTTAQGEFDEPLQTCDSSDTHVHMTKPPQKMAPDAGKQPGSLLQVDGLLLGAGGEELDNSTHVQNHHSCQAWEPDKKTRKRTARARLRSTYNARH